MPIHEFVWPQDRIDHIAQHGVTPEEVEQMCFGRPLIQRAVFQGENPVCYVLGQTEVVSVKWWKNDRAFIRRLNNEPLLLSYAAFLSVDVQEYVLVV